MLAAGCTGKPSQDSKLLSTDSSSINIEKEKDTPSKAGETVNNNITKPSKTTEDKSSAQTVSRPNKANTNTNTNAKARKVDLLITRDFGTRTLFAKTVGYKENATILDVLKSNLQIETKYGGSFINSINGLVGSTRGANGKRQDWFNYINGICCDVGVLDYNLETAAAIWWDYHPWMMGPSIATVIGSYPEPFLHGYEGKVKPTIIMSSEDDLDLSKSLQAALKSQGVSQVKVINFNEGNLETRPGPTIVIGKWDKLKQIDYLEKLNQAYSKTGTCVYFSDKGLELLDYSGKAAKKIDGSAGVIVATGQGLGDDSPLWLVAGTDEAGLHSAINVLTKNPDKIKHMYNAAILADKVMALPLQ